MVHVSADADAAGENSAAGRAGQVADCKEIGTAEKIVGLLGSCAEEYL